MTAHRQCVKCSDGILQTTFPSAWQLEHDHRYQHHRIWAFCVWLSTRVTGHHVYCWVETWQKHAMERVGSCTSHLQRFLRCVGGFGVLCYWSHQHNCTFDFSTTSARIKMWSVAGWVSRPVFSLVFWTFLACAFCYLQRLCIYIHFVRATTMYLRLWSCMCFFVNVPKSVTMWICQQIVLHECFRPSMSWRYKRARVCSHYLWPGKPWNSCQILDV